MQILWMKRQQQFIFAAVRAQCPPARDVHALSRGASLDRTPAGRTIRRSVPDKQPTLRIVAADVHRFEQSIAGHAYLIEVSAVSKDRWRANIVRLPGLPTAMMPFYGRTPIEAAELLSAWLTRAHERAAAHSS